MSLATTKTLAIVAKGELIFSQELFQSVYSPITYIAKDLTLRPLVWADTLLIPEIFPTLDISIIAKKKVLIACFLIVWVSALVVPVGFCYLFVGLGEAGNVSSSVKGTIVGISVGTGSCGVAVASRTVVAGSTIDSFLFPELAAYTTPAMTTITPNTIPKARIPSLVNGLVNPLNSGTLNARQINIHYPFSPPLL